MSNIRMILLLIIIQGTASSKPPNFLIFVADDLGRYDTSITNPNAPTPTIGNISQQGLILERHYVFRFCSPTRRALLTGRFPTHLTTVQADNSNLCSDFLPLNATIISEKLMEKSYESYFIGKGHLGYQTTNHLPINRGFKSHVGFLAGAETYAHGGGVCNATQGKHDLWKEDLPAYDIVPTLNYSSNFYTQHAVNIIESRSTDSPPFFMYFAIQNVHTPYTLPPVSQQSDYPQMWDRTYANMLHVLDSATLNLTRALQHSGQWDNTLVLWIADNGGIGLGNNHPLRGHKHDPWEGGTRGLAFLSGGFLPSYLRGTRSNAFVHVSDWWPTICMLSGMKDCTDLKEFAKDGEMHDIDGVNVWPMLTHENLTQPRIATPITEVSIIEHEMDTVWWKLVTLAGQSFYYEKNQTTYNGTLPCLDGRQPDPPQPGRTDPIVNDGCPVCNETFPCLFNIIDDPNETQNVATRHPDVVKRLQGLIKKYEVSYVTGRLTEHEISKYEKIEDPDTHWNGYLGPCYYPKE